MLIKKKILVTGASGLIGRYCLPRLLAQGFEVHVVGRTPLPSKLNVISHQADLFESEKLRQVMQAIQPSHLLHCAWMATPGIFWTSPDNIRWLSATIELMKLFGEVGGKRAVCIGSCAEYDWSVGGVCQERGTPLLPSSIYGQCKLAASEACAALASVYGVAFAWGRLFFPYGVGEPESKFISSIIQSLVRGETVQCSHGRQVRDFLYLEDVGEAICALISSQGTGTFNIGSGQPISLREVVGEITSILGGKDRVKFGSKAAQPGEPLVLIADMTRLFEQISWRPQVDLSSGIKRMIAVNSATNLSERQTIV